MKRVLITVFVTLFLTGVNHKIFSQEFIRVYNNSGMKIAKGKLLSETDSSIEIKRGTRYNTVLLEKVSFIKTKRSAGHNIAVGTAIGAGVGVIAGIAASQAALKNANDPLSFEGLGLAVAAVASPIIGAAAGTVTGVLRKRKTFEINGDPDKWKEVREKLLVKNFQDSVTMRK